MSPEPVTASRAVWGQKPRWKEKQSVMTTWRWTDWGVHCWLCGRPVCSRHDGQAAEADSGWSAPLRAGPSEVISDWTCSHLLLNTPHHTHLFHPSILLQTSAATPLICKAFRGNTQSCVPKNILLKFKFLAPIFKNILDNDVKLKGQAFLGGMCIMCILSCHSLKLKSFHNEK